MASVILKLTTPVPGEDGQITALELREPTGKDIRQAGVPFAMTEGADIKIDAEAMHKMITALSGQAGFVIDRLSAADWNAAMGAVMGFFGAPTPAQS